MSESILRAYVIGQTPRPDLTDDLERRLPGTAIEVVGALNGLANHEIETCDACAYPLETRLRDGTRIVIEAGYVEARLQRLLAGYDGPARVHLVLCAGPFPALALPPRAATSAIRLLRPFDTAVQVLRDEGHGALAVLVPFEEQAGPATRKWREAGFHPREVRALTNRPADVPASAWVASWAAASGADAVVFDYVGFPSGTLNEVAAGTGLPVFDLGHLTLDLLADALHAA